MNWKPADLLKNKAASIKGDPAIVESPFGKAVAFNGVDDAIFIDEMPLNGLNQFTVEAVVFMASGGKTEQRLFHCGTVRGDRMLFETRTTETEWFLDAFINSSGTKKVLIDSAKLHPLDRWYHIAFVADNGKLSSFVNGKKEVAVQIPFVPLSGGQTSIGVRQNLQSWFKGTIYEIKMTSAALQPPQFLRYGKVQGQ